MPASSSSKDYKPSSANGRTTQCFSEHMPKDSENRDAQFIEARGKITLN
jgi:DNA-binding transcriptional regulator LsrR (DeoR family)